VKEIRFALSCSLITLTVIAAMLADARAAEPPAKGTAPTDDTVQVESKAASERATEEIAKWKLVFENDDREQITAEKDSVLRWSWSDNGRLYGNVFVYTARGRPVAIVEFFSWFSPIQGTFFQCTSLTSEPMKATRSGQEIWSPRSNNVVMQDVPQSPVPAETTAVRLIQMRRLANAIQVEVDDKRGTGADTTIRQLRLLSKPMHRYGNKESEVLEGAMFSYSISTDPGAILILEAVPTGNGPRWRYGLARVWSYGARATLSGKPVWIIDEVNPRADSKANFYLNALP
jgi:hypothetical protein